MSRQVQCSKMEAPMIVAARLAAGMTAALLLIAALDSRQAAAQNITEFTIPTPNSGPSFIARGPDGALWFTEPGASQIGRITTAGAVTEFPLPASSNPATPSRPGGIVAGPDGALWFTDQGAGKIGRITTAGSITEFNIPTANSSPTFITVGADGALWFTEAIGNKIGRLSRFDTSATEFPIAKSLGTQPEGITAGPDGMIWFFLANNEQIVRLDPSNGNMQAFALAPQADQGSIAKGPDGALWFTEFARGRVGPMTTAGLYIEFPLASGPVGITTGPDGALWYTDRTANKIGRVGTSITSSPKASTQFAVPTTSSGPDFIAAGPDGALWFTEQTANKIGRLSPPASTSKLFAATLPASRSIQIGHTATAFATIINTGPAATNCGIVPVSSIPGSFVFQTTNPNTNALTGSPNTRVPIAAGANQSFVVAFTAGAGLPDFAQVPVDVVLGYACDGVDAAATIVGVNTLLLTFDANPVPDMIAVGVTPSNDGFSRTGGPSGIGLFAIASSNIGASGSLTARVRLSNASLPIAATICQTNPSNGQCLATPAATVTTTINQNQNQTWTAFLQASGTVAPDPANSRAFFEFVDSNGVVRGSTSTAVTTQ
jgi:virginiamycin B lyase